MPRIDDDDDKPRPKKKRRDDDDDGDAAPKKKRRKDDDDEPNGKKKNAGVPMLYVALGIGGVGLILLLCCGGGVGGYFLFLHPGDQNIVGRWESKGAKVAGMQFGHDFEFRADGTATKAQRDARKTALNFKYRVEEGDPRILVITHPPVVLKAGPKQVFLKGEHEERVKFRINRDILTLTHRDEFGEVNVVYRRAN